MEEISVQDLNGRYLNAVLTVKSRTQTTVDESHPIRSDAVTGGYLITYTGKCKGTINDAGIDCLLIDTTVGARQRVAIPLESIEDVSLAIEKEPANFPVSGLERNPLAGMKK